MSFKPPICNQTVQKLGGDDAPLTVRRNKDSVRLPEGIKPILPSLKHQSELVDPLVNLAFAFEWNDRDVVFCRALALLSKIRLKRSLLHRSKLDRGASGLTEQSAHQGTSKPAVCGENGILPRSVDASTRWSIQHRQFPRESMHHAGLVLAFPQSSLHRIFAPYRAADASGS